MDDAIKIARELGLPGLALVGAFYLCHKIGAAAYEGLAWFGPQFLIPIRDALVANISILTVMIVEVRTLLPKLTDSHEKSEAAVGRLEMLTTEMAKDGAKTRATSRAAVQAMSAKCPERADKCPFKQEGVAETENGKHENG